MNDEEIIFNVFKLHLDKDDSMTLDILECMHLAREDQEKLLEHTNGLINRNWLRAEIEKLSFHIHDDRYKCLNRTKVLALLDTHTSVHKTEKGETDADAVASKEDIPKESRPLKISRELKNIRKAVRRLRSMNK